MSGKLVMKHAFGINPQVRNCLAYADDHHVTYVCGHQIVVINTETKEQSFIQFGNQQHVSLGITAVACSIPKKYIAVAEKSDPVAIVTLFDSHTLRKKKVLHYAELGSRVVKSIAFSEDGRFCLTQGAGPEWNLVLWNVEKAPKVICSAKISMSDDTPVNQVTFCPWDPTVVVAFGKSILRLFRIIEGQMRPGTLTIRRELANIVSHCWVPDDYLIVGTESGEILFIENLEFRGVIYPVGGETEEISPIWSLAPTSRGGFVAGCSDGELKVFERQDEIKEQYQLENTYHLPGGRGSIQIIAVGTDDNLVLATDTQQMLHFTVSSLQNAKKQSGFDSLFTSFHSPNSRGEAAITGIDVALWKPIIVSSGKDRTVRLWNPTDKKIELMKEFDDEPTALAVHPSGIFVAVGFNDKIKILSVLLDDLCLTKEMNARYCSLLKFSKGGHFIAALNGSNIQVFNTFTGVLICTLRGHNNKIRNIEWLNFDARLMSIGSEGAVFFWDIFPPNRRPEQFSCPVPFLAGCGPSDGSKAYVVTSERIIKEISFTKTIDPTTGLECSIKEPRDMDLGRFVSTMMVDETRNFVLMGTSDDDQPNAIIAIHSVTQMSNSFDTTLVHSGHITAMVMSYDGSLIITGDSYGCVCVSEYEGATAAALGKAAGAGAAKGRDGTASFEFHDEVVVHKAELESRKDQIAELTARVDELNLNNEHQMRLKEMEHTNKVKDISVKFSSQLKTENEKFDRLLQEKNIVEEQYKKRMQDLTEKQLSELRAIDVKYKTKLNAESNRHKTMMAETEEAHRRWNEENAALVESHQAYIAEMTADYEEKLHGEQDMQRKIQDEREYVQVQQERSRGHCEDDADFEINEMKIKYELRLRQEDDMGIELMAQHALMKKNLQMLNKDAELQRDEIRRLRDKESRLLDTIRSLEKDIQSHKKEIREREETITDKEKRIFDLKKKNQELEKFRFVLDYKIKELKLQIAPREHEIATMRKQIEEMDLELEQYHKSNQALNLMISELKLKIDGLRREMELQEQRIDANARLTDKYKRDLQELWEARQDANLLKSKMVTMYRVYVQEDLGAPASGDDATDSEDPQQLYNRDREQMERSLDALRRAVKMEALTHKRDVNKMMREGVVLTKELNVLRKDARHLLLQQKAIDQASKPGAKTDYGELLQLLGVETKAKGGGGTASTSGKSSSASANGGGGGGGDGADATMPQPPPSKSSSKHRSSALRTTSAHGRQESRTKAAVSKYDQWEAWREIEMQTSTIQQLESQLEAVCHALGMDPMQVLSNVEANIMASTVF